MRNTHKPTHAQKNGLDYRFDGFSMFSSSFCCCCCCCCCLFVLFFFITGFFDFYYMAANHLRSRSKKRAKSIKSLYQELHTFFISCFVVHLFSYHNWQQKSRHIFRYHLHKKKAKSTPISYAHKQIYIQMPSNRCFL